MANVHRFAIHNGALVVAADIRLSPFQTGLLSGWGLFSTLRIYGGVPFALEDHLQRLAADGARLRVDVENWLERAPELFELLIGQNRAGEAMARVYLIRNHGGLLDRPVERKTDLLIFTADLRDWGASAKLRTVPHARHAAAPLAATKSLSWAHNLATLEGVAAEGFHDALLLNERGEIAECTSANIFVVKDGAVLTPPLAAGALPGISRKAVLEGAAEEGLSVREATLWPADLRAADEVFISSSTREVQPVGQVDDFPLPPPGAVTARVRRIFATAVKRYVEAHAKPARVTGAAPVSGSRG